MIVSFSFGNVWSERSDLSSVRVDLKTYGHDSCTQRARKSCDIFFLYICPSLTVLSYLLPVMFCICTVLRRHCWLMWTLAWRHTYEDIVIQYTWETHRKTGCLIPAEVRFYIYRIDRKDILFNLILLNCHLRDWADILNHSRNWDLSVVHTLKCTNQKKYWTKLCKQWFDRMTVTKIYVCFVLVNSTMFLILLLVHANTFQNKKFWVVFLYVKFGYDLK